MISANKSGYQDSLHKAKTLFMDDLAAKADCAEAQRGYQGVGEKLRSPDRKKRWLGLRGKMCCGTWEHELKKTPQHRLWRF